jgi:hypothetical protein
MSRFSRCRRSTLSWRQCLYEERSAGSTIRGNSLKHQQVMAGQSRTTRWRLRTGLSQRSSRSGCCPQPTEGSSRSELLSSTRAKAHRIGLTIALTHRNSGRSTLHIQAWTPLQASSAMGSGPKGSCNQDPLSWESWLARRKIPDIAGTERDLPGSPLQPRRHPTHLRYQIRCRGISCSFYTTVWIVPWIPGKWILFPPGIGLFFAEQH